MLKSLNWFEVAGISQHTEASDGEGPDTEPHPERT